MLQSYGVLPKPTKVKNPQSNGVHERMHLVLYEILRTTKLHVTEHSTAKKEINRILQAVAWTMRASVHMITKFSPGQIIFQSNIIIHKMVITDWELIHARRRAQQIRDNDRENKSRTEYKYKAGDISRTITKANE